MIKQIPSKEIKDYIAGIKLGLEFFTKNGPKGIEAFSEFNIPIFLDLKFYDIKNTVIKTIKTLDGLPINYLSIHLLNGKDTLLEAKKTVDSFARPIKLLGITILTSFSETDLKGVGIDNSVSKQVSLLANLAKKTGLDGVVCSFNEIKLVKGIGSGLEIFVPGIRLKKNDDEQKRKEVKNKYQKIRFVHPQDLDWSIISEAYISPGIDLNIKSLSKSRYFKTLSVSYTHLTLPTNREV